MGMLRWCMCLEKRAEWDRLSYYYATNLDIDKSRQDHKKEIFNILNRLDVKNLHLAHKMYSLRYRVINQQR
ncbi:MAG: hypothetical protein RL660_1524 [Bacteroidota bacterium]|jgi:hypothetical protein